MRGWNDQRNQRIHLRPRSMARFRGNPIICYHNRSDILYWMAIHMNIKPILLATMLLVGCEQQPLPQQQPTEDAPMSRPAPSSSSGFLEHMAGAAVAGAAAGSAGAASHALTNHAIERWKVRKRARRWSRRR